MRIRRDFKFFELEDSYDEDGADKADKDKVKVEGETGAHSDGLVKYGVVEYGPSDFVGPRRFAISEHSPLHAPDSVGPDNFVGPRRYSDYYEEEV